MACWYYVLVLSVCVPLWFHVWFVYSVGESYAHKSVCVCGVSGVCVKDDTCTCE